MAVGRDTYCPMNSLGDFPQRERDKGSFAVHAIQNLHETVSDVEQAMVWNRKHLADLTAQTDQPFEYAEKLTVPARRQQEITDALDLTKNQASGQLEADASLEPIAVGAEADTLMEEWSEAWL